MLNLRGDQFEMFERRMFSIFRAKVESALAHAFPELPASAAVQRTAPAGPGAQAIESMADVVEPGIERAVEFDLQEAPDVAEFIALFLALRLKPATRPTEWIRTWLERPDTPGEARLALVRFEIEQAAPGDPALRNALERMAKAREGCRDGPA